MMMPTSSGVSRRQCILWSLLFINAIVLIAIWWFSLPSQLFQEPYSTVIESQDGQLLYATVADDGQWRFPPASQIPHKYFICTMLFEDKRFLSHPGVDPIAMGRALWDNITHGEIKSGGSTITMQVIRLYRKQRNRTILEKLIEIFLALRLECQYTKHEIFTMYMNNAPFGSNVVGIEAAAWRYFGVPVSELTWAQAATLAVLPNAPSLIFPGKNQQLLKQKRNKLLRQLLNFKYIDKITYDISIAEDIPTQPEKMPQKTLHLFNRTVKDKLRGQKIITTVLSDLQNKVQEIIETYSQRYAANAIYNAAAIVIDVQSGHIIAYAGNTLNYQHPDFQSDMISALRSPGSTLKPLLYYAMLNSGMLTPDALVPDIPIFIDGFYPQNVHHGYDGAVKASDALARSLNVPAVIMLKRFGVGRFHYFLKQCGISTITKHPSYYGLALILGGCEVRLDELTAVYAAMAHTLNQYNSKQKNNKHNQYQVSLYVNQKNQPQRFSALNDAGSIWYTLEAMKKAQRPDLEQFWQFFSSSYPIAWKTGTSYGNRDAWAIGVTPQYAVGVWVGNSSGYGRPGLTGINYAAPIMFEIFQILPCDRSWFQKPVSTLFAMPVCPESGFRVSEHCNDTIWIMAPRQCLQSLQCPYHKTLYLDSTKKYQVFQNCYEGKIHCERWFSLPPAMEQYYLQRHQHYKTLPPVHPQCLSVPETIDFDIIYPIPGSVIRRISVFHGHPKPVIFRAAHKQTNAILFWHINEQYYGQTTGTQHQLSVQLDTGHYVLTVTDETGKYRQIEFSIAE